MRWILFSHVESFEHYSFYSKSISFVHEVLVGRIPADAELRFETTRTEYVDRAEKLFLQKKIFINKQSIKLTRKFTIENKVQCMITILHKIDHGFHFRMAEFGIRNSKVDRRDENNGTDENKIEKIQCE